VAPVWFLRCDIATRVGVKQNRAQIATGQAFRPLRPVDGFEYEKLRGKHGVRIQQFHDSGMCANDDLNFCFEIDVASRQSGPFRIAQTIEFVDVPKKNPLFAAWWKLNSSTTVKPLFSIRPSASSCETGD